MTSFDSEVIKVNGCTPKRRLSFVGYGGNSANVSPMQQQLNKNVCKKLTESNQSSPQTQQQQPNNNSNESPSNNNESPFIKRKCLNKEIKFNRNGSPCFAASSSDLVDLYTQSQSGSPRFLNESFETMKLASSVNDENELEMRKMAHMRSKGRRASYQVGFFKHKSAPLASLNLNKYLNTNQINTSTSIPETIKPCKEIHQRRQSVAITTTTTSTSKPTSTTPVTQFTTQLDLNISLGNGGDEDEETANSRNDLEKLIFGYENVDEEQERQEKEDPNSSSCLMDNPEHHHFIKQSLEIDAVCSNMIGDRSKTHILPVIPSAKHSDLYCISPETLVGVLNGKFNDQIDEYIIVDSRYPYEYEGGHIHNALNIFTKDKLFEEMFIKRLNLFRNSPKVGINHPNKAHHYKSASMSQSASSDQLQSDTSSCADEIKSSTEATPSNQRRETSGDEEQPSPASTLARNQSFSSGYLSDFQRELNDVSSDKEDLYTLKFDPKNDQEQTPQVKVDSVTSPKRVIVIFHCEFSSERGPGLLRFLRNQDRALNEDCYPYLHYPELYLLEGGYKSFYEHFKNYCDPQMYKPMLHEEHINDLKHFRAKAKSWEVSNHLHNLLYLSSEFLQKQKPAVVMRFKSEIKK